MRGGKEEGIPGRNKKRGEEEVNNVRRKGKIRNREEGGE